MENLSVKLLQNPYPILNYFAIYLENNLKGWLNAKNLRFFRGWNYEWDPQLTLTLNTTFSSNLQENNLIFKSVMPVLDW